MDIKVKNLTKYFNNIIAVDNISFEIENNKTMILIFLGFIINAIVQIFSSSLYSSSATHEMSSLINIEQMGAVTIGTISMFAIFALSGYAKWKRTEFGLFSLLQHL